MQIELWSFSSDKTYWAATIVKTNVMLLDEKANQWNSTGSSETDPNTSKNLPYDKVACHISKATDGLFTKWHQDN